MMGGSKRWGEKFMPICSLLLFLAVISFILLLDVKHDSNAESNTKTTSRLRQDEWSNVLESRRTTTSEQSVTYEVGGAVQSVEAANAAFKIVVLAGENPETLQLLLSSIAATDYGDDKIVLEVQISGENREQKELSELVAKGFRQPAAVVRYTYVQSVGEGPGSEQSWRNAWPVVGSANQQVLIVDDSVELSPSWYRFVRKAWSEYMGRTDVAGISLTRQIVTTSAQLPLRMNPIVNDNKPYLHPLVVGPAAFSPHPDRWAEFLQWINSVDLDKLRREIPNFMTSLIKLKEYDELFLYHSRKAAGTTMADWLKYHCGKTGFPLHIKEGVTCPSKFFTDTDKRHVDLEAPTWLYNDRVLSITTIRDPVSRVFSAYSFEGRWKATDTIRSEENEVSLEAWINKTLSPTESCNKGHHCWHCSSECFHHWFGGHDKGGYDADHALEVLNSFDLILYTSDMKEESYWRSIHRMFGDKFRISNPNVNPTNFLRKYYPTAEDVQRVTDLNPNDIALVANFTGGMRDTLAARDWFYMIDEEVVWTMWTQLFTYWCKLNKYSILHVAPTELTGLAVSRDYHDKDGDFAVFSPEAGLEDETFAIPREVRKYDLGGILIDSEEATVR